MRFVVVFLFFCLLILVGLAALIYSGTYNVAATDEESPILRWILATTMENSVEKHAGGVILPEVETEENSGFVPYDEMCVMCHSAPGIERTVISKGLTPSPPRLADAVGHWRREELFWIVSNGIKRTGMPAFGPTHEEKEIKAIVDFATRLPNLSAEEYRSLRRQSQPQSSGHTHSH